MPVLGACQALSSKRNFHFKCFCFTFVAAFDSGTRQLRFTLGFTCQMWVRIVPRVFAIVAVSTNPKRVKPPRQKGESEHLRCSSLFEWERLCLLSRRVERRSTPQSRNSLLELTQSNGNRGSQAVELLFKHRIFATFVSGQKYTLTSTQQSRNLPLH